MPKKFILEICLDSVESAMIAQEAGADRVELCANLSEGGTTPSIGTIQLTRKYLHIPGHVIIRPRGGDFCYSDLEFDVMKKDILAAKQLGVDGFVFGILDPDANVDFDRTSELVELAKPQSVTFHRAFDMTSAPFSAMENIIKMGADRILTSGWQQTAEEGILLIALLVEQAGDRIIIMPGSGINERNIVEILKVTHAKEIHMSANTIIHGKMQFKPNHIHMGSDHNLSEFQIKKTDPGKVKRIAELT